MHASFDDTSDREEDFFAALALLHSSDDDSIAKLRKMFDMAIEQKYGFSKTLTARMSEKCVYGTETREKLLANGVANDGNTTKRRKLNNVSTNDLRFEDYSQSVLERNTEDNNAQESTVIDTVYEDYTGKGDLPRISIPDEGSADDLLCKLGPLILLECQDCQDVYYPLYHQPPTGDVDVYDPGIVWRCQNCVQSFSLITPITAPVESKSENKIHHSASNGLPVDIYPTDRINVDNERNRSVKKTGIAVNDNDHIQLNAVQCVETLNEGEMSNAIKKPVKTVFYPSKKRIESNRKSFHEIVK